MAKIEVSDTVYEKSKRDKDPGPVGYRLSPMEVLMGNASLPNARPLIFRANRWMLYRSWSTLPK